MNYVGLDIHKNFTYGVVKSKEGEVLNKARFENTEENFGEFLAKFPPEETKVVMESTGVWEHIYDILENKGYQVKLANPTKTRAIAEARIKTDAIDAATLSDLLRADLVAESYIPPKEIRRLRDIVRQRKTLVKGRTQIKNKIHAIIIRHGIKLPYRTLCTKAINWLTEETNIKDLLVSYLNLLENYNEEINCIEEKIKNIAAKDKQAQLITTIPGIGPIRAMEITTEIGEINRFENSSKLCSYAGLVPSIKQSGNTLRFGRLIRQSSKSLKGSLIQASWVTVRTKEANKLKLHYLRLKDKKSKQKAICATARKMLCIIYAMLRNQQEFIA